MCFVQQHLTLMSEGIPTIVIVPVAYFLLPKGPGECRFLNQKENEIVRLRAVLGRGIEEKGRLNVKHVFAACYDYKNYFQAVIVFCLNVRLYYHMQRPCADFNELLDSLCRITSIPSDHHQRYRILIDSITRVVCTTLLHRVLNMPRRQLPIRSLWQSLHIPYGSFHRGSSRVPDRSPCQNRRRAILCDIPDLRRRLPRRCAGFYMGH